MLKGCPGCPGCLGCPGCPALESEPNGEVNGHGDCSYQSVCHYNWLTTIFVFLWLCFGHGTGVGEPVAFVS